jgi:hypothetical protein
MSAELFAELIKTITAVLAAVGAVVGLPVAFFQIRKTIAEIRKIELETKALEEQGRQTKRETAQQAGSSKMSQGATTITDPKLTALFLLLSDLIVAGIILIIANYALDVFLLDPLKSLIVGVMAMVLLSPIALETLRMRNNIRNEQKGGLETQIKRK